LLQLARDVERQPGDALVVGRMQQHGSRDLLERDHPELLDALPDDVRVPAAEEARRHLLDLALGAQLGQRAAALSWVRLLHEHDRLAWCADARPFRSADGAP